jgi:hypothetical protein
LDGVNGDEEVEGEDEEALRKLTYENDRDVLQRVIDLIEVF